MENNQKLSFLEKVSYGVGDMGCNFIWYLVACMATFFYTEYFGLPIGTVTAMMAVVTVIDLFFDVIVGAVADRHKFKMGRFRPWIFYGFLPFAAVAIITFYTPDFNQTLKLVYAFFSFLLLRLMYSVVNVPYGALLGVISADPNERDSTSAFRNIFAQVGWFFASTFCLPAVKLVSDALHLQGKVAFFYVVCVYAVIAAILLFCTATFTKERVEPVKQENNKLIDDLKDLVSNKPWVMLTLAGIMMLVFTTCHNQLINYYCKYYLATMYVDPASADGFSFKLIGTFFGAEMSWETFSAFMFASGAFVTIVATILSKFVVNKFGKKMTWIGCFVLSSIVSALFLVVGKESLATIILLQILFTLFIGPSNYLMWSMYGDIADKSEVETGRRATGMIFSSATMAQKLGNTLAAMIPGVVLAGAGYVANDINMSESIRNMILVVFALFPIISAVFSLICLFFYNISEEDVKRNAKILEERRLAAKS